MYKGQLATLYNQELEPQYALKVFNNWIAQYPGLLKQLMSIGYTRGQKILTPAQVKLIVDALGEP